MKKRGSVLLLRIFTVVTMAVFLCYVITTLVFSKLGSDAFADIKIDEMLEKTRYIAEITAPYIEGRMTDDRYRYMLGDGSDIWGAAVYAYDANKNLVMRVAEADTANTRRLAEKYLPDVLAGKFVRDTDGIVIGCPAVSSFGNVIGAVFMVKPLTEVRAAAATVKRALVLSCVLSVAAMIIPIFIVSEKIVKPITKMNEAAKAMAVGNYSVSADVKGRSEIASLGRSLNELARSLSDTVGELKAERNKLKSILDGIDDGVLAFNSRYALVQFNPAAIRLMGGKDRVPIDCHIMKELIDNIKQMNGDSESYSFELTRADKVLHFSVSRLSAKSAEDITFIVLIHDVTEAARYEQSRKDYVANVSHELRTPIASIKSISEAFSDGLIPKENEQKYYGYLLSESSRLSRLINDLLELSRIQSGKVASPKRKTDVYDIIMGVADRYSVVAGEKNMVIVPECDERIQKAYTNDDRVEQVLIILVDNAIKHSESDSIIIRAVAGEESIIVSVINDGSIDENDIEHIFERFYKADRAHSSEGTGLGLSIASEIMEMLGEKLWVESENGVVNFSFTLKRADRVNENE